MASHFDETISQLQKELEPHETKVREIKTMVNSLCKFAGRPAIYADADLDASRVSTVVRTDEFYGQPLAKNVRRILEIRKTSGSGPATVREIYDTLLEGGYEFDTKDANNAQRGLRISLAKNVAMFHKLPNGRFGLVSWYPNIKVRKSAPASSSDAEDEDPNNPANQDPIDTEGMFENLDEEDEQL